MDTCKGYAVFHNDALQGETHYAVLEDGTTYVAGPMKSTSFFGPVKEYSAHEGVRWMLFGGTMLPDNAEFIGNYSTECIPE